MFRLWKFITDHVGGVRHQFHQRCVHCDTTDYWKWVCFKCHEETSIELIDALQLQLNVAVLNMGNPGLLARLAVMDGDECIGLVVPDTLKVIDDMGILIPKSHREKLSGGI